MTELQAPSATHPGLTLVDEGGRRYVLKQYDAQSRAFRLLAGWWMARREARAYRRLAGIAGVPVLRRRVPPDGLLLEYVPSQPARDVLDLDDEFFDRLRVVLGAIRNRGVLHGDVVRNVLVDEQRRPVIVDFGSSFVLPAWWGPVRVFCQELGARYNERAIAKLKRIVCPDCLTPSERDTLSRPLPLQRVIKFGEWLLHRGTAGLLRLARHPRPTDAEPRA